MIDNPYYDGFFVREVEKFVSLKVKANQIPLPVHLSIGQEMVSVAIVNALSNQDYIWGTYRSHALFIARTKNLKAFFSELLGKVDGCSGGMGGSMHLHSKQHKILGTSGIVGTHISNSVGFAYGKKMIGEKNITCCVFGDGATDSGTFYDSLNIASLFNIPIMFFIEDNNLAIRTEKKNRQSNTLLSEKIIKFDIKVFETDGSYQDMYNQILVAKKYILEKSRPACLIADTVRWYQHLGYEYELNQDYRDYKKEDEIIRNDEINKWLKSIREADRVEFTKKIELIINTSWIESLKSDFPNNKKIIKNIR